MIHSDTKITCWAVNPRTGVRTVKGCPDTETHGEHDWIDRGVMTHCYGWTAGREVWK